MYHTNLFKISFLNILITACISFSQISSDVAKQPVVDFYDKEAPFYDEGYMKPLCIAEEKVIMILIESMITDKKVLDVGCGTGLLLNYFKIDQYLGIDISPNMIRIAESKFPENQFVVANMDHIVKIIDSESYDCIICLFGPISYSHNPVKLINEFYRILAPGGHLIFMPYTRRAENNFFIGEYNTATQENVQRTYYTTNMVIDLMAQTEFDDVKIRGINYFGNFVEVLDGMYGNPQSEDFFFQLLLKEQDFADLFLPIEYARHSLVIAKKEIWDW